MLRLSRCLATASLLLSSLGAVHAATFLLEAERLEIPGGWEISNNPRSEDARGFVTAGAAAKNAPVVGAIQLPHAGKWRVFVRSKDFPNDRPGTRLYTIRIGDQKSEVQLGKHGQAVHDGWAWEDAGIFEVPEGPTLVVLGEDVSHSSRCDALVFTDNMSYTPEGVPWKLQKAPADIVPLTIKRESTRAYIPESVVKAEAASLATLQNDNLRVTFHQAKSESGADVISMRVATRDGDTWKPLGNDPGADSYRVLHRPANSDPRLVASRVYPTWNTDLSPKLEVSAGKSSAATRLGIATAPWASGRTFPLRPTAARQVDPQTVELTFPETAVGQLKATWKINGQQPAANVDLHFTPKQAGHVSLGYHGPLSLTPTDTDFMLLPYMFHGHRFPDTAVTLLNALTPTPLTLVNRDGVSCALVAEPSAIPFEWPGTSNSRYAFGLRNEFGQAQPLVYSPVLGQPGSVSDGAPVTSRIHLWVQRGDWYAAYRRIADEVFQLKDYRRPTTASLSDAALNMFDLLKDEKAAGWDARSKGPWNIERPNLVSHSAPLTYLSYYLLTGDQDFYRRFALPTLEYLVSRPSAHFGAEEEIGDGYYSHQPMRGPGNLYGATTFSAAYAMTHGRSPIFGEYSVEKGEARRTRPHGHSQPFDDALALYRLTGEKQWLDKAIAGADDYIEKHLKNLPKKDLGTMPFINNSFVPNWEGLLHMYEATGLKRYLDGATEGSRWLMTSLWTQPVIPKEDITIHPGGEYDHARYIWWWGNRRYRRGVYDGPGNWENVHTPAPKIPERKVPAWKVSQVGMGLEQPSTYTRGRYHANISMSNWSANMLRLAQTTSDEAFLTSARNATIGRFANYPGYYHDGFTDEYQRPDYPFTGPDITSLYMHHAPVMAGWVLDYLFTDVETRSKGAVAFPWVRQNGYVWFDNRLRGHAPGKVYGRTAWPWLHRTAASVDNVAVDRVLAHGDGAFHVVLLNQTREPQTVQVSFDEKTLGRSVDRAELRVHQDNKPAEPLTVKGKSVSVALSPLGIATLTLEGVKIDVPTHRVAPPKFLALPKAPASTNKPLPGTKLKAIGTVLQAPPFETRDFYVYLTATINECSAATLRYRIGDGPEQQVEDKEFPFEFSVPVKDPKSPITWEMDVQLADGKRVKTSAEK